MVGRHERRKDHPVEGKSKHDSDKGERQVAYGRGNPPYNAPEGPACEGGRKWPVLRLSLVKHRSTGDGELQNREATHQHQNPSGDRGGIRDVSELKRRLLDPEAGNRSCLSRAACGEGKNLSEDFKRADDVDDQHEEDPGTHERQGDVAKLSQRAGAIYPSSFPKLPIDAAQAGEHD